MKWTKAGFLVITFVVEEIVMDKEIRLSSYAEPVSIVKFSTCMTSCICISFVVKFCSLIHFEFIDSCLRSSTSQ